MHPRTFLAVTSIAVSLPAHADWKPMQGPAAIGTFRAAANTDSRRLGAIFMCDQISGLQFIFIPDLIAPPGSTAGVAGFIDLSIDGENPIRLPAEVGLTPDQQRFRLFSVAPAVATAAHAAATARKTIKVTFVGYGRPMVWQTFDAVGAAAAIFPALSSCGYR